MIDDEEICRYVFDMPCPCIRFAHYSTVFGYYAQEVKHEIVEDFKARKAKTSNELLYQRLKPEEEEVISDLDLVLARAEVIESICEPWIEEIRDEHDKLMKRNVQRENEGKTKEFTSDSLEFKLPDDPYKEIHLSYPPQFIVGTKANTLKVKSRPIGDEIKSENGMVRVQLVAISCEYNYSIPIGTHNLHDPDMKFNVKGYPDNYSEYCRDHKYLGELRPRRPLDISKIHRDLKST